MLRRDLHEVRGRLIVVESIEAMLFVVRRSCRATQIPVSFDVSYDASELECGVFDVGLHVRRDDDHRHAEAEAALVVAALRLVQARGRNVIVEAAPVVPEHDNALEFQYWLSPIALTTLATHDGPLSTNLWAAFSSSG